MKFQRLDLPGFLFPAHLLYGRECQRSLISTQVSSFIPNRSWEIIDALSLTEEEKYRHYKESGCILNTGQSALAGDALAQRRKILAEGNGLIVKMLEAKEPFAAKSLWKKLSR